MRKKLLVAPLDWGLGHATRCIPVINSLINKDFEIVIAAEGATRTLLALEFPHLKYLDLKGYRVEYGRSRWELVGKMLWQIPQILESIDEEREWLRGVMNEEKFDIIISDNRYGLTHPDAHCIFLGHQMLIKTSLGNMVDEFLQPFQLDLINKFDECWIPDFPGEINLAGELSHPDNLPRIPVSYIGPLSRLKKTQRASEENILIMLSGPEPQRSILEEIILEQAGVMQSYTIVRGLPGQTGLPQTFPNIRVVNHLTSNELNEEIEKASLVVARCGYSTVMDLVKLQKKSVLIPTPGQTEQEYLSGHLMQQGMALCFEQEGFELDVAIAMSAEFNFYFPPFEEELLEQAVGNLHGVRKLKISEGVG